MSTAPTRVLDRERREELGDDDDEREGLGEDERDDGGDDEGDDENTNSDRVSVPISTSYFMVLHALRLL